MKKIIEDLIKNAEYLGQLFVLSPTCPTEKAKLENRPDRDDILTANTLSNELKVTIGNISSVADDLSNKINLMKLDSYLSYFRSMSKMMDYRDMHWSTSYDDIHKSMVKIGDIVEEIDYKYTLGNVKIRKEQNEKNNKNES